MSVRPPITFVVGRPVNERDREVWGFERLAAEGLEVCVLDVSHILGWRSSGRHSGPERRFVPRTRAELREVVRMLAVSGVFVDYIVGLHDVSAAAWPVFRDLKRADALYYVIAAGDLPLPSLDPTSSGGRLTRLRFTIAKAASPRRVIDAVARHAIRWVTQRFGTLATAFRIFGTEAPALARYASRFGPPPSRIVRIHSLDFDRYIRFMEEHPGTVPAEDVCIFLDEGATSHPDFETLGLEAADPGRYFAAMRRSFEAIECRTGLRTIVAAHPTSDYSGSPEAFGDREIIYGRTVEEVAEARCVVAHASTAIGFAVLFDKPLLLVETSDMRRTGYAAQVRAMAGALGLTVLDVDDSAAVRAASYDYEHWSRDGYRAYRECYLAPPGTEDRDTWATVASCVYEDLGLQRETGSSAEQPGGGGLGR